MHDPKKKEIDFIYPFFQFIFTPLFDGGTAALAEMSTFGISESAFVAEDRIRRLDDGRVRRRGGSGRVLG